MLHLKVDHLALGRHVHTRKLVTPEHVTCTEHDIMNRLQHAWLVRFRASKYVCGIVLRERYLRLVLLSLSLL